MSDPRDILIDTHPELCLTAGELRAMGGKPPDSIPDCAWVPRHSIRIEPGEFSMDDDGVMHGSVVWSFTVPFTWVEFTCEAGT